MEGTDPDRSPLPTGYCRQADPWWLRDTQTLAQFGVGTVASSTGSLLFNIKKRAHNCIKTCIIIPEEGRAQPLVIAGLL